MIKCFLSYTLLVLFCAGQVLADVTYEETYRILMFDGRGPQARVPSIEPPVFDIPASLYSPSFDHAKTTTFKVYIKGNKMARLGDDTSSIFDLDAQTVTTLLNRIHRYTVESFAEAQRHSDEMMRRWLSGQKTGTYTANAQRTGHTRVLDGQTAEEYRIIGIGHIQGRNRVAGSSVYWVVAENPSDGMAEFRAKWAQRCSLPFPSALFAADADTTVMAAMTRAAVHLGGYPVRWIVETRPPVEADNGIEPTAYGAEWPTLSQAPVTVFTGIVDSLAAIVAAESAVSNFAAEAVSDDVFVVPAGFTLKKGLGYLP
jgi:hypothetical protein